jgi:hypothetical protein
VGGVTTVCLLGKPDCDFRTELLSYETARAALSPYDLEAPYENTVAVETVSLGMAVSLLGDLDWYLRRLAEDAFVRDPSVHPEEYLSRRLATAVRDGEVDPEGTGDLLKVYGVVREGEADGESDGGAGSRTRPESRGRLVEPMFVSHTGGHVPEYDLREVADTVLVRVTPEEFG